MPVRDENKAKIVFQDISQEIEKTKSRGSVEIFPGVDFQDLSTVRRFALQVVDKNEKIDILINNAGMITDSMQPTKDGNEQQFQVNHLAPFLLTHLLLPALAPSSRVVFVSSTLHYFGAPDMEKKYGVDTRGLTNLTKDSFARYQDTKLMNIMCANGFQERFPDKNVQFSSLHPGSVASNIFHDAHPLVRDAMNTVNSFIARSTDQGAVTQVTVATHPALEQRTGGRYFSDYCIPVLCDRECLFCDQASSAPGVVPHKLALDKQARDWLWQVSSQLVGL